MVIIIGKDDLLLPDFPFPLIQYGKYHAKLVTIQYENTENHKVIKSIYSDMTDKVLTKDELLQSIDRSI